MATQALYLRWRPSTFEEVVGQEHITATLRNALVGGRIAHAYLFSGPRGTGKTTMARLLAKAINCLAEDPGVRPCNQCPHCLAVSEGRFLDMIEIDAASYTGVDDVRDLRERIAFAPNEGRYKVYIIDEVHRFSGAAFDALLKTIEEPPAHAIFVLATTEVHKVPQTILSRCQRFDFRRIPLYQIINRLREMVEAEELQAEQAALELVARYATGSLRDAISLLDQLISGPEVVLTLELAQTILGTAASETVRSLVAALVAGDVAAGLEIINSALDQGIAARQFARQIVEYLRLLMLVQTGSTGVVETLVSPEELASIAEQAGLISRQALLGVLRAFNEAASDTRGGWQPQLPLEMAFLESVDVIHAPPVEVSSLQVTPAQRTVMEAVPTAAPVAAPSLQEEYPGAPTLEELRKHWREVRRVARQLEPKGVVEALLNSIKLYAIRGYTVILQAEGDVVREKIEADPNREVIEAALQRIFGQPLQVSCRVQSTSGEHHSDEVDDLLAQDSVVAFAVHDLGGRIRRIGNRRVGESEEQ